MSRIGRMLDGLVGTLSPRKGLKRHLDRIQYEKIRSAMYAAAKTTRVSGEWSPVDGNVNDIIAASTSTVRARVRQLVRDFPYFARAVNISTDYTVGPGIQFQSRVTGKDGKLDKDNITAVESALNFWMDEADVAGRLHYYELMELAKRQDMEPGEFLLVKHFPKTRGRYLPYALQIIEPDWLTEAQTNVSNKAHAIHQGVEYETATGRVMAYHFTDPDTWGSTTRVDASRVIHGFKTLRPGQLRGISPFAPGVLLAKDLSEFMDATIDTAKLASKWLALITTEAPQNWQGGLASYTKPDGTTQRVDSLENAIIEYLQPGEDVKFPSNPNPGENFDPFVRLILTMFSVVAGIPYELISGDYRGLNYTVSRTVRNDFAFQLRPVVLRHIRHFGIPAISPVFDVAVMSGKLSLPGYFANPAPWVKAEWQPPGMEAIDPLRESKSQIDQMNSGLRSPYEIVKARGRDLEDVYKEIQQAKDLAEQYGLSFSEVSTALANNPAALDPEDDASRSCARSTRKLSEFTEAEIMDLMDMMNEYTGRA